MSTLWGAFFLSLDRLQQIDWDPTHMIFGVALVDPAAAEYVLRHWKLIDSIPS
jgi:hypothetical protein